MAHITNWHDKYFRDSFANPVIARQFCLTYLDPKIVNHLNLDSPQSLELVSGIHIDEKLKELRSDLVFTVELKNGKKGYVYIHIEHQSTPDKWLPFRVLEYKIAIMRHHWEKLGCTELPVIFSMVYYTGQKPYQESLDIYNLFGEQEKLAREHLVTPVALHDVCQMDDEVLRQHRLINAIELCFKHVRDPDILKADILFEALGELDRAGFRSIVLRTITYMVRVGDTPKMDDLFERLIPNLTEATRKKVMTIEKRLEQRGIQIGEQRGRLNTIREMVLKLWNKGLGKDEIACLTDLDLNELEDLLKDGGTVH